VAEARLVVVGFGSYRETLGRFVDAIGRRNLETLHEIAARGRELDGGPQGELKYLNAFLEGVGEEWLVAAPAAAARTLDCTRLALSVARAANGPLLSGKGRAIAPQTECLQLAAISAHPAAVVGTVMPLRGWTENEAIAMPTLPSLEGDSPAGRWTSRNQALDRFPSGTLFSLALQEDLC
jgi:hypothetical protein